jgi:carboxypeptidase Q
MNSNVRFDDSDTTAYNILADIQGSDRNAGYVMAGAHFDSWVGGDGAADNGAGSVVVMEAARIISQLGIQPRRTIRFALWSGEEQGLFGSRDYTQRYIATRPAQVTGNNFTDYIGWMTSYPVTLRPGHSDLKVYFNMDNGSGRLRGLYGEGNVAAMAMLQQWLSPFASLGATSVVAGQTRGTDHEFFNASGIPAFQFIQDPLDYGSRLHHTNIDTFDHLQAEDLRQAAVVIAGVLLAAANTDETLPRIAVPTQPSITDPFEYEYPDE